MTNKIKLVTASAGSGKTYKLQETLAEFVNPTNPNKIRPEGVIATTFTNKSALELKERARKALIKKGYDEESIRLEGALISTVHSVCTKIIEMYSYEAGLLPKIEVIPEEDSAVYFNVALSTVLNPEITEKMEDLVSRIVCVERGKPFDWRKVVSELISHARSNSINSDGLAESFDYSWSKMKECLPPIMSDPKAFEAQVLNEGKLLYPQIEILPKKTKADEEFLIKLKVFLYALERGWSIRWDQWQGLTGSIGAAATKIAISFQGLVSNYISHPQFQSDYEEYLKEIFLIASKSMEAYQAFKKERGLLDFVDMECIVSDLLDDQKVQQRIGQDFDLLMVDEFQDTSPIQLNIFLKLSKIINHVIWVGDQKQSIYGFRGADPALMKALLDKMDDKLTVETLGNSYRSREDLVFHANALFTKIFEGLLDEKQVKLNPTRKDLSSHQTPIEIWRIQKLERHSQERSWRGIAKKIRSVIEEKKIIAVKDKNDKDVPREITFKDIAILVQSNSNCAKMATYLTDEGLPVSLEQDGFLNLPESKLMMAAMRYYTFSQDSLAAFEIKLLIEGKDNVEELIEERIDCVSQKMTSSYAKDYWALQRIDELKKNSNYLSPVEVVNNIIVKLELQRIVSSWEGLSNRTNNLDIFRQQALKFEEYCRRLNLGATLGGFLLWISDLDANNLIGYGGNEENAITIMTWHKSKGLEWPVVIFLDCQKEVKKYPFGFHVFSKNPEIDLANPLKERLIRFWPNYLQKSRTKTEFHQRVMSTQIAQDYAEMRIQEARRLLYVGFTRARDYLYIPLDSKAKPGFISECLNDDSIGLPTDVGEFPLSWAQDCVPAKVIHFDEAFSNTNLNVETHKEVLKPFTGPQMHANYLINPSRTGELPHASANLLGSYGKRLTVKVKVDDDKLGDCLHDIAALSKLNLDEITKVLKNYKLDNVLIADEIQKQLELYDAFLMKNNIKILNSELPIMARFEGQFFNGVIDQLASENDEVCIIDHKSYQGTDLEKKSTSFSGQLDIYRKALELSGKKVKRMLIHFITLGVVYEVKV